MKLSLSHESTHISTMDACRRLKNGAESLEFIVDSCEEKQEFEQGEVLLNYW